MATINQLIRMGGRKKKIKKSKKASALSGPFAKAVCESVMIRNPKKPNSAKRKCAKVKLVSNGKRLITYIPGMGHDLAQHSTVLVRQGKVPDLPGVSHRVVRGVYDTKSVDTDPKGLKRNKGRSKYGVKKHKKN
jgi:small subunit ribosomal protein S12